MADRVYARVVDIIAEVLGIHGLSYPQMVAGECVDRMIVEGLTITDPETLDA